MGLFDFLRSQFIDIIEWADETPGTLVHRFERYNHEIKRGAKLIVRPGQAAIFVNEGKIADHFGPGTYTLDTANLPILTNLLSIATAFESWHKAEVYFVKTTIQLDRHWGTPQPIMMRDTDFGLIRIRAFGNYAYKVGTTNDLLERLVGSNGDFTVEGIEPQFSTQIVSEFSDLIGELHIPALDLASQYNEIGERIKTSLVARFSNLGFELVSFTVGNINLPEEVNKAIDQRGALGALGGAMNIYTQKAAADAMKDAANNSGMGGTMMGMMVGGQMGNMINQQMMMGQQAMGQQAAAVPPPPTASVTFFIAVNGNRMGPYSPTDMQTMANNGTLTPASLVWTAGMVNWQAANTVPQLQGLFMAPPPPPAP